MLATVWCCTVSYQWDLRQIFGIPRQTPAPPVALTLLQWPQGKTIHCPNGILVTGWNEEFSCFAIPISLRMTLAETYHGCTCDYYCQYHKIFQWISTRCKGSCRWDVVWYFIDVKVPIIGRTGMRQKSSGLPQKESSLKTKIRQLDCASVPTIGTLKHSSLTCIL